MNKLRSCISKPSFPNTEVTLLLFATAAIKLTFQIIKEINLRVG